jgi:hypothetical protein
MLAKPRRTIFLFSRADGVLLSLFIALAFGTSVVKAGSLDPNSVANNRTSGNVACRDDIASKHREVLANSLKRISGWPDLEFDQAGILRKGSKTAVGGSKTARELLAKVLFGNIAVVLEDVSRTWDVAFMRVVPARWKTPSTSSRPAFVVQIDFADFDQVIGDATALQAFDAGWGLLHEFDHIVHNSEDASSFGETGECEQRINQMRRECNLPQRVDYFYTASPLTSETTFTTRLVRLQFEQTGEKKKRYWVVWDANLVGGLNPHKQVASMR